jgi:hypothetical protein
MMRLTYALALFAAVSAFTTMPAMAQTSGVSNQLTFKGGIFTPAKGPVKDIEKNWWIGGVEYALGNPDAKSANSLEVLYTSKSGVVSSSTSDDVDSSYKVLSFALNRKIRNVARETTALGNILFYGAGVGVNYVDVKVTDPNPGSTGNIDKQKMIAGANVFVGYDIAANFQVEAKYQLALSKVEGQDMSGLQILFGFKF